MAKTKRPPTDLALTESTAVVNESTRLGQSLTHIRARALHNQTETDHTIVELEAWRAEIDATIAFLKAQKKADRR